MPYAIVWSMTVSVAGGGGGGWSVPQISMKVPYIRIKVSHFTIEMP